MKEDYQDHIDEYLSDRMSDKDKLSLEEQISKNDELCEQLEFTKNVKAALRSRNEKIAKIKIWEQEEHKEQGQIQASYRLADTDCEACPPHSEIINHQTSRHSAKQVLYWISGIAAAIVVGAFFFNIYPNSTSDITIESKSHPDYILKNKWNMSFKGRMQGQKIECLLEAGDYKMALAQAERIESDKKTELLLIERELGSRGEETESSDAKLDTLRMQLEYILYLKAQALIGLDRKEEALELLKAVHDSDSKYSEQADSLYQLLIGSKNNNNE